MFDHALNNLTPKAGLSSLVAGTAGDTGECEDAPQLVVWARLLSIYVPSAVLVIRSFRTIFANFCAADLSHVIATNRGLIFSQFHT